MPQHSDEDYASYRQRSPFFKALAVLLLIGFLFLALPQVVQFWGSKPQLIQDPALTHDPVAALARAAIVVVEAQSQDGLGMQIKKGTGFNVDVDGMIITNQHVLSGADAVSISFIDGRRYFSNRWKQAGGADIAVIDIKGRELPALKLDYMAIPHSGQEVTVIGNPLNMERLIQKGTIFDVTPPARGSNLSYIEVQVTAAPGLSGSPVINEHGRVIAVVYAARKKSEQSSTALAIPVTSVYQELEQTIAQLGDR